MNVYNRKMLHNLLPVAVSNCMTFVLWSSKTSSNQLNMMWETFNLLHSP